MASLIGLATDPWVVDHPFYNTDVNARSGPRVTYRMNQRRARAACAARACMEEGRRWGLDRPPGGG
jgi:hypothetical protein